MAGGTVSSFFGSNPEKEAKKLTKKIADLENKVAELKAAKAADNEEMIKL